LTSDAASEEFKAVMRGKLDALLSLAEDTACRSTIASLLWRGSTAMAIATTA
jgi:hypothetical protein